MPAVEVLANPECPHCLRILDHVARFAEAEGVPVAGVDIRHHPEAAHGFEHSPVVYYGHRYVLGMPTLEEFRTLVGHRNP